MTKLKVFIDFEAISMPFSKDAGLHNDFPYAYTLGMYVGKKFKTRTYVFNFKQESSEFVYKITKENIAENIRNILSKPKFKITKETIEFVGWSPVLEKRLLAKMFEDISVVALNKGFEQSLSRLTPEINDNYFAYTKEIIIKHMAPAFIRKRAMEHDGAIAAYVGYLLHAQVHNKKGKYVIDFEVAKMVKELKKYSKEDVTRMRFLNDNPELFKKRKEKGLALITEKNKVSREKMIKERLLKGMETFDKNLTINQVITSLKDEINSLEKKKEEIDNNFKKI